MIEKRNSKYYLDGSEYELNSLLAAVLKKDDEIGGRFLLSSSECESLNELFSSFINPPKFEDLYFMSSSKELFSYLASSQDEELLKVVAINLGLKTVEEQAEMIHSEGERSVLYRRFWSEMSKEVLTTEGFDEYRFGAVKRDRNGCYLYDDEKAVLYVEISRDGDELRDALISFTLLGNPEAIEDENGNREFEWCCYFDDLLSKDDSTFLGGKLRAIDPYGTSSKTFRRYDCSFKAIDAVTLGLVVKEAAKLLLLYPPTI